MRCIKGVSVINASEKAFRLIYEPQGYQCVGETVPDIDVTDEDEDINTEDEDEDIEEESSLDNLSLKDLKALAKEKGITGYSNLNKEELLTTLQQ